MSLQKDIVEETEFAKNHLMQSNLDEKCKKSLLRLLNISTMATNGISLEEKVQKITEIIYGLVVSQITFLDSINKKIESQTKEHCKSCKAMKHAIDIEEEEKREQIIDAWKLANGIKDENIDELQNDDNDSKHTVSSMSWLDILKLGFIKPYGWIVCGVAAFSPYCVDIMNAIINFFK